MRQGFPTTALSMSEDNIIRLETLVPPASGDAFAAARRAALAAGQPVMANVAGVIYSISPEGGRVPVKKIEGVVPVTKGQVVLLQ
jgi:hypothetical protein